MTKSNEVKSNESKKVQTVVSENNAPQSEDAALIKDTLLKMQKELLELKDENKELRKEFSSKDKAAIEAAREEMITDDEMGPCYVDEKYKEEGYVYRTVDTSRPGRVNKLMKLGYEIVYSDGTVEDSKVSESNSLAGAVTIELGTTKSTPGVLMRITKEQYDKRQRIKERRTNEDLEAALGTASSGAQFGEITIGDKTHFRKD